MSSWAQEQGFSWVCLFVWLIIARFSIHKLQLHLNNTSSVNVNVIFIQGYNLEYNLKTLIQLGTYRQLHSLLPALYLPTTSFIDPSFSLWFEKNYPTCYLIVTPYWEVDKAVQGFAASESLSINKSSPKSFPRRQ